MKTSTSLTLACVLISGTANGQNLPLPQKVGYSGNAYRAIRATAITGLTTDGQYIYGQTIELGQGNANRVTGTIAYDSAQMADVNGTGLDLDPVCADLAPHAFINGDERYWFGLGFSWQAYAEDIVPAPATEGEIITEVAFAGVHPLCDAGAGTQSEVLQVVFESWEGFDNFADFDGTDGRFGFPQSVVGFPASRRDINPVDGLIDEYLGGIVLTFANIDTDGDTFVDQQLSSGSNGYSIFYATGLDVLGVPLTSNLDLWDGGKTGTDGFADGGVRLLWTRGDGGIGGGPFYGLYPSTKAQSMLWGTYIMQGGPGACGFGGNFGEGSSRGTIWGEGEDICLDGLGAWSQGGPSGNQAVDEVYDTYSDLEDWSNGYVPDFSHALGLMIRVNVVSAPQPQDCCDVNLDGACTPADFSAWIAAFNAQLSTCDINQDGACTPADFSAWIAAFNASMSGNPQQCIF